MIMIIIIIINTFQPFVHAQFGVGNRKQAKENTRFQELQEMAKAQAGGAGTGPGGLNVPVGAGGADDTMADLQKMFAGAFDDPNTMDTLKQYGDQFGGVLEQMMQMSPDDLQKTMEDAMKLMTQGDIVDTVIGQKDTVLQTLESTGMVPPEELEKYKNDPEYFELKMRESFGQMKDLFTNPEYLNKATEAVQSMKDIMTDPTKLTDLAKSLTDNLDWTSDEKLEEVRLQFLNGEMSGIPGLDTIFQSDDMQAILQDPIKWKETVKDGLEDLLNMGVKSASEEVAALNIDGTKVE